MTFMLVFAFEHIHYKIRGPQVHSWVHRPIRCIVNKYSK